ncbi:MAG TPA: MBL fold metallo-hydrolase [Caulobacteraceae bacterium]|nr:MBL fold metallo-hydrolase [Caulobacteraceae bacterium]
MTLQWRIGKVRVTRIVELEATGGSRFILPAATREEVRKIPWLAPHFADDEGRLRMSVHALVVETPSRRILVDTCIGNDKERTIPTWSHMQTRFLQDLEAAGFAPGSIDTVLCTHLHVDHVGWNTRLEAGRWVPTFPTARYLIGRAEFAYWQAQARAGAGEPAVFQDSVQPVFDAGLVDLVETDHVVCAEVRLEPTLGHTPGHVSVRIASDGEEALITGDFLHHPCQMARPEWASSADFDPAAAMATRRRMFGELAGGQVLVIGTHFAAPTAGRVVADGARWRLEA